ncbi:MAG TPA: hypothetical protein VEC17_00535 [Candidatus Binatia bacterium]|nr:hypothetical protein [Candidatus Binatia bacterium]
MTEQSRTRKTNTIFVLSLLVLGVIFQGHWLNLPVATAAIAPELPRVYVDSSYPAQAPTKVIRVKSSCTGVTNCFTSLQQAIDSANLGEEIVVDAGMTFTGPIKLREKTTGTGWIIIRTSNMAALPPAGQRVGPQHASAMFKIKSGGSNTEAIVTNDRAHNYRLVGIEVEDAVSDDSNVLILLGPQDSYCATVTEPYKICSPSVLSNYPYNLVLDRMYIHGHTTHNVKRGVELNSKSAAIVDSYISEIHTVGQDTQAIGGWNGPGPYKIVNNFLAGAGENILFGGADPRVDGLTPADIEIRKNHVYKPLTWRVGDPSYNGRAWAVKNLFETKNAKRILVDSNIFENNWSHGQTGVAILIKPENQSGGCLWCTSEDITFTNNIVKNSGGGISLQGNDYDDPTSTGVVQRLKFSNNLFILDGDKWGNLATGAKAADHFILMTSGGYENGPFDVEFSNNTALHTGTMINMDGRSPDGVTYFTRDRFVYINNIAQHNRYGIFGSNKGSGDAAIAAYLPGAVITKNILMGTRPAPDTRNWSSLYTNNPGNYFPKTWADVGFMDMVGNNFQLASTINGVASPYKNAGTNGKDLGVDVAALNLATAGVAVGNPTVQPPPPPPAQNPTPPPPVTIQDTVAPVITTFNVSPRTTTGPISVSFTTTDAGGSNLQKVSLKVAAQNSTCTTTVISGCNWTTPLTVNAPSGVSNWTTTLNHTLTNGSYIFGLQSYDNAGNRGFEPALMQATASSVAPLRGDINLDRIVNSIDFSFLNLDWFTAASRSDLNTDGIVNAVDFSLLNSNWFKTW